MELESQKIIKINCSICGMVIPNERLEILPETDVCVLCTSEPKKLGIPSYGHKTGGSVVIIDPREQETLRRAKNQYRRTRWAG